jgi:hypothetical protein
MKCVFMVEKLIGGGQITVHHHPLLFFLIKKYIN